MGALTADPFYVGGSPEQSFDIESLAKGFDGIYKDGPMRYGKKVAIPYRQLRNVSYASRVHQAHDLRDQARAGWLHR